MRQICPVTQIDSKRTITVENAVMADTPVIDCATFLNSRCAPFVKTISSRFSAGVERSR